MMLLQSFGANHPSSPRKSFRRLLSALRRPAKFRLEGCFPRSVLDFRAPKAVAGLQCASFGGVLPERSSPAFARSEAARADSPLKSCSFARRQLCAQIPLQKMRPFYREEIVRDRESGCVLKPGAKQPGKPRNVANSVSGVSYLIAPDGTRIRDERTPRDENSF
jgi:hypothetical protein